MSKISADDVKKLAVLSALSVTDDEVNSLRNELESILDYVEQLDAVDTTGLEPTYQVTGLVNVTREDKEVEYGVTQNDLLKNAPDKQDDQIKVRRVL